MKISPKRGDRWWINPGSNVEHHESLGKRASQPPSACSVHLSDLAIMAPADEDAGCGDGNWAYSCYMARSPIILGTDPREIKPYV